MIEFILANISTWCKQKNLYVAFVNTESSRRNEKVTTPGTNNEEVKLC